MLDLTVSVMTYDRSPSYLDRTLGSLGLSDRTRADWIRKIHLILDTDNPFFCQDLKNLVDLHYLTKDQELLQKEGSPRDRINLSFKRAIQVEPGETGLIFMEDDILFRTNWLSHLEKALEQINKKEPFALWLHQSIHPKRYGTSSWRSPFHFEGEEIYTTCCVLLSPSAQKRLKDSNLPQPDLSKKDLGVVLSKHMATLGIKRFGLLRDLAQHGGYLSSDGLTTWLRGSHTFHLPWEPISSKDWINTPKKTYEGGFLPRGF